MKNDELRIALILLCDALMLSRIGPEINAAARAVIRASAKSGTADEGMATDSEGAAAAPLAEWQRREIVTALCRLAGSGVAPVTIEKSAKALVETVRALNSPATS